MNLKSSAKTIIQMPGCFKVFQIYDCWSAEKVKILPCFGLLAEVRGIGIQKCFGMACCFRKYRASSCSVNGESQDCRHECRIGVWKTWPVAGENGERADVAY